MRFPVRIVCFVLAMLMLPGSAHAQAWVERSNEYTQLLIDMEAGFTPEAASINGVTEYDGKVMDLGPRLLERQMVAAEELAHTYREMLAKEADRQVAQDLEILIAKLERDIQGLRLQKEFMLQWVDLPELIFTATSSLLGEQTSPDRRAKALELVERYTGLHPGSTSVFEQARAMWKESQGTGKIGPYSVEIEQALANYPTFSAGIRELFDRYHVEGAAPALERLDREFNDYATWTKSTVLPSARDDFRLPEELYAFSLRTAGIEEEPEGLIARAKVEFFETRSAMEMLAVQVGEKLGLENLGYREVIRALKRNAIPREQIETEYLAAIEQIEKIIEEEGIVSLPSYDMKMRLASEAESAAQPAPHMQPPPLIGNTGQQGVFVLTSAPSSKDGSGEGYDDFSFAAATWTLSAHEGRPGHELQFAAMVENGVSLARGLYAFNSVNVEGWALYAEAEMVPYEPVEGQLIAMQHRLLRAARAFLDPMLNLGQISREDASKILSEDVILSPAMVKQELDRYTFNNPGQAASYFYGYSKLLELRVSTELALGKNFDRKAFNDFMLGLGLLPPEQMRTAVEREFIPAHSGN